MSRGVGVCCKFCGKKKRRKKRRVSLVPVVAGGQVSRMASASGQTYVRQALPPRFTLCESWWP